MSCARANEILNAAASTAGHPTLRWLGWIGAEKASATRRTRGRVNPMSQRSGIRPAPGRRGPIPVRCEPCTHCTEARTRAPGTGNVMAAHASCVEPAELSAVDAGAADLLQPPWAGTTRPKWVVGHIWWVRANLEPRASDASAVNPGIFMPASSLSIRLRAGTPRQPRRRRLKAIQRSSVAARRMQPLQVLAPTEGSRARQPPHGRYEPADSNCEEYGVVASAPGNIR